MPRQMCNAPAETAPGEPRALEFFFHKSAPQLAGFFERAFWKGSVLQSSLAEPAIRQAIAAIAVLHEQQGRSALLGNGDGSDNVDNEVAVRLYNKAIRQVVNKTRLDPDAVPVITMASVLFTCFEFLRGDATTAEAHIANGVRLLQSWRDRHNGRPLGPWGRTRSYALAWTSTTEFMETELAPILSLFNMNTWEFGPGNHRECKFGLGERSRILLNGLDQNTGQLLFPDRFESLREARIGIVDLVTLCAIHFQSMDQWVQQLQLQQAQQEQEQGGSQHPTVPSDLDMQAFWAGIRTNVENWKSSFDALLLRRRQYPEHISSTDENETPAAETVLRIMWFSITLGMSTYCLQSECAWDDQREAFEEILSLAETLVADPSLYPDDFSRTLSLDLGLIFPLHSVAWKCRYPSLRHKGLDLLHRIPKREWLFDAERFHGLLQRIMEIEHCEPEPETPPETPQQPQPSYDPETGLPLPAERCRVRDFFAMPIPTPASFATLVPKGRALHRVTFEMAGNPADNPHQRTEYLWLPSPPNVVSGDNAEPVTNMLSCKQWARPDFTDGASVDILRKVVFGGPDGRFVGSPSCTSPSPSLSPGVSSSGSGTSLGTGSGTGSGFGSSSRST